jgi:hypothetical protein
VENRLRDLHHLDFFAGVAWRLCPFPKNWVIFADPAAALELDGVGFWSKLESSLAM